MSNIMVSVICNTYNHEAYIRQCLESIVNQKTSFNYEVLVHDDASTDKTATIIKEFENAYPKLIKPIYQTENQYLKGGIRRFQYPRVTGKYIAFCEGDDYWTDPLKLQLQFDALEKHPEVDICAHGATLNKATDGSIICMITPRDKDSIIDAKSVIYGDGGFVATNTLMYRAKLNQEMPGFRKALPMDYTLQIQGSLRGGMLYLSRVMSVYRYMVPGSWTEQHSDGDKLREFQEKKHDMLRLLDNETNGKYHKTIDRRIRKDEFEQYYKDKDVKSIIKWRYRKFFCLLPVREQMKTLIKAYFPLITTFIKRIKSRNKVKK